MSAIDAEEDFSRNGTAAPTAFTVCIMSVRKDFSQLSSESPTARALTLQTSASSPPSSAALAAIHCLSAGPSATSSTLPKAFTPLAFSAETAAATSPSLRAQIETCAPSAAKPSAIARPIPLLPPVTATRFPLSPRSMSASYPLPEIVDIIAQSATGAPAREIVEEDAEDRLVLPERVARGVRRDNDVGHVPQRRGGIERLA